MKLYLIRHGETDWNRQSKVLGRTDIPLNENGRRQAREAAQQLQDTHFAAIYASPLSRAMETAQVIAAANQHPCNILSEDCLMEQDFGTYEATDWLAPVFQETRKRYTERMPGGESLLDIIARVHPFLQQLEQQYSPEDNVLVVTHNSICGIIWQYYENKDMQWLSTFIMDNCAVRVLDSAAAVREPDDELFDILTETGEPTGTTALRRDVHRTGAWHGSVHIWVYQGDKVLMQRRAATKESYPGMLDASSSGHISAGETSSLSAMRETEEELGIHAPESAFRLVGKQQLCTVQGSFVSNEWNTVYLLEYQESYGPFSPDPIEIDELQWIALADLAADLRSGDPNRCSGYCFQRDEVEMLCQVFGI